jgi:hypothetical protein
VSEGHEKRIDPGGVMGDLPLALGTVVSQYLDHLGIHEHVEHHGADQAAPAEAAHEAADESVDVLNDLIFADT